MSVESLTEGWLLDPNSWVKFFFPKETLDPYQKIAFDKFGELVRAKISRYNWKVDPKNYPELTDYLKELSHKIGVSIMAGRGVGKDYFAAMLILWFLYCFPNCRVMCTANTEKQLKNVLWSEIAALMNRSVKQWEMKKMLGLPFERDDEQKTVLNEMFVFQSDKIYLRELGGKVHFAEAVTIGRNSVSSQGEVLSGRHARFMLYVLDEASGIPDNVFAPLESSLTGIVNLVAIIFNPTRYKGFAVESHTKNPEKWIPLQWNAELSTIVDKDQIRLLAEQYGVESNRYRVDVLGMPPLVSDETLIPWDWIVDAQERELVLDKSDPMIGALDVGAGGDDSAIVFRKGGKVLKVHAFASPDVMTAVEVCSAMLSEFKPDAFFVDNIGIGAGVFNRLQQLKDFREMVHIGDVRRSTTRMFGSKRDELWWKLRDCFEKGLIQLTDDKEMCDELDNILYNLDERTGEIRIEGKKAMRVRRKKSPNRADALMMTMFAWNTTSYVQLAEKYTDPDTARWAAREAAGFLGMPSSNSWQAA